MSPSLCLALSIVDDICTLVFDIYLPGVLDRVVVYGCAKSYDNWLPEKVTGSSEPAVGNTLSDNQTPTMFLAVRTKLFFVPIMGTWLIYCDHHEPAAKQLGTMLFLPAHCPFCFTCQAQL